MILASLDFAATLDFKVFIDLGFRADFKATLGAVIKLILNAAIKDLVF